MESGQFLVVHGMPGSGKSVLAAEAVRDPSITLEVTNLIFFAVNRRPNFISPQFPAVFSRRSVLVSRWHARVGQALQPDEDPMRKAGRSLHTFQHRTRTGDFEKVSEIFLHITCSV